MVLKYDIYMNELMKSLDIEPKYLKYPELLYDEEMVNFRKGNLIFKLFKD